MALSLPSEVVLGQEMQVCDPDALHEARQFLRANLAETHRDTLLATYNTLADSVYSNDQRAINNRRLKSAILAYLSALKQPETMKLVARQFHSADNMTDAQTALMLLADLDCPERDDALTSFYEKWRADSLVLDKWFSTQSLSKRTDTVERVQELTKHPDFTISNPNRVRSVLGAFAQNQVRFHGADGAGYKLLADFVLEINSNNAQLAARLVSAFNGLRRFNEARQSLMEAELKRISAHEGLSKDVFEIVERALKS